MLFVKHFLNHDETTSLLGHGDSSIFLSVTVLMLMMMMIMWIVGGGVALRTEVENRSTKTLWRAIN